MDEVTKVARPVDRRWVYASGALLTSVLVIIAGMLLLPVVTVVPGTAVANQAGVIAAATDRKAADDAAAAKKAADDAAAFLANVEATAKESMQDFFNDPANNLTDPHVTVYTVTLINVGNNKFEGMADCSAGGGPRRQIAVHVIADDQNVQWSTDKGALLPLFDN